MTRELQEIHDLYIAHRTTLAGSGNQREKLGAVRGIKQLEGEVTQIQQIDPSALQQFAADFDARYAAATPEERKRLDAQKDSPALRARRTGAEGSLSESASSKDQPTDERKKGIYDGCNKGILPGNARALNILINDMLNSSPSASGIRRSPGHDNMTLFTIIQSVGRDKSGKPMSTENAIKSLKRSVNKLFIRVLSGEKHADWLPLTEEEKDLFNLVKEVVVMRHVRQWQNNYQTPTIQAYRALFNHFDQGVEKSKAELTKGMRKTVRGQLDNIVEHPKPYEYSYFDLLNDFKAELDEWKNVHKNDPRPAKDDATVPAYQYDLAERRTLQQVQAEREEAAKMQINIQDVQSLFGLIVANNNYRIGFAGKDLAQFVVKEDVLLQLRQYIRSLKGLVPEMEQKKAIEGRRDAVKKLAILLEKDETAIDQFQIQVEQLDVEENKLLTERVRAVLRELRKNSIKLGGADALAEFLLAEDKKGPKYTESKTGALDIHTAGGAGYWEASPAIAIHLTTKDEEEE